MRKTNKTNFETAALKLPVHKASPALWTAIESQLSDANVTLNQKLPTHVADDALWHKISTQLPQKAPRRFNPGIWQAAASVALLAALGTALYFGKASKTENGGSSQNEIVLLQQNCAQFPEICASPDYVHLKNLLENLTTERNNLQKMSLQMPDARIKQYEHQINSDIDDIQHKILKLFL